MCRLCWNSLSHREYGSSISFLTGHEDIEKESLRVNFAKFGEVGGTLCIYMGMGKFLKLLQNFLMGGLPPDKPAAIVSHGTLPSQKKIVTTLGKLLTMPKKLIWSSSNHFCWKFELALSTNKIGLKIAHYLESELW